MDDHLFLVKQMEKKIQNLSNLNDSCIDSLIGNFIKISNYSELDYKVDIEKCYKHQDELNILMNEYDILLRNNPKLS